MADNFLERQRRDYEERKAAWLRKKRGITAGKNHIERPEDESLWYNKQNLLYQPNVGVAIS